MNFFHYYLFIYFHSLSSSPPGYSVEPSNRGSGLEGGGDLSSLPHTSLPCIVSALKDRFTANKVYSRAGPVIVSVNPHKQVDNVQGEPNLEEVAEAA